MEGGCGRLVKMPGSPREFAVDMRLSSSPSFVRRWMSCGNWIRCYGLRIIASVVAAWGQPTDGPARPGPQSAHTLVYDEQLRRVVLISGHGGSGTKSGPAEVWTFDGTRWERLFKQQSPGPVARFLAAAAYDYKRRQLVLFGGRVGKAAVPGSDTWLWDHRRDTWREVAADGAVGVREHHSMAYDEGRNRTVMYGGTVAGAAGPQSTRTWPEHVSEWDGIRWHIVKSGGEPGPGARNGAAIAYDGRRKQVVLFGGVGEDRLYRRGTWTWDGKKWTQATTAGDDDPPLRATHQMAYDSRAGVVLLYGGGFTDGVSPQKRSDMWKWDGKRWTEIALLGGGPTPGPRVGHAMAYDRARGRLVLFGGFSEGSAPIGDTWEWDGARWTEIK
jgi:hypothetical protein